MRNLRVKRGAFLFARSNSTGAPVMICVFVIVVTFTLILIVLYFVIKIFNMVKDIQATRNETAIVENARASQRAFTTARDFNDHYPDAEEISNQRVLWNDRILGGTPAIRRLPRHNDERLQ